MSSHEILPVTVQKKVLPTTIKKSKWDSFLLIEKMDKDAVVPTKGTAGAAGYDLYSFEQATIDPWSSYLFKLKIKIAIPPNMYGRIASRSGLASKHNIEVGAGVIDNDYRGEIMVLLRNFSNIPYVVKPKDRIAQIIFETYLNPPIKTVTNIEQLLGKSIRNDGGLGSTGL